MDLNKHLREFPPPSSYGRSHVLCYLFFKLNSPTKMTLLPSYLSFAPAHGN